VLIGFLISSVNTNAGSFLSKKKESGFMVGQKEDSYDNKEDMPKKKVLTEKIMRWIFISFGLLLVAIVVFRSLATGTPKELQNYIIKSPEINEAYMNLKNDLTIYQIKPMNPFAAGAAFHDGDGISVDNVYYFEDVDNLQIIVRLKNNVIQPFISNSESPFRAELLVCLYDNVKWAKMGIPSYDDQEEITIKSEGCDVSAEEIFGKSTDRYQYIIYSFGGVNIDYLRTQVYLYLYS